MRKLKKYNQLFENDDTLSTNLRNYILDDKVKLTRLLLSNNNIDLNELTSNGYSYLLDASSIEMIELLCMFGADVNIKNEWGEGILETHGVKNTNIIYVLLENNLNIENFLEYLDDEDYTLYVNYIKKNYSDDYYKYMKNKNKKKFNL